MPKRSSETDQPEEAEESTRRNPRRTSASSKKSLEASDDADDNERDNKNNSDTNPASSDEEEESDEEPLIRRPRKRAPASKNKPAASSKGSDTSPVARRSSRSTKFTGAMKEPPSDSVRDLFRDSLEPEKLVKNSGRKSQASRESTEDGMSSSDESEPKPKRRQTKRGGGGKAKARASSPKHHHKSPARRHSLARKSVLESDESASESEDDDDDHGSEEQDQGEIKIQRILASRSETRAKWKEICGSKNTSEITDGSRWFQEENALADANDVSEERFLTKWSDLSYLHTSWETQHDLIDQVDGAKQYLSTFFRKSVNGILFSQDERNDGDYFDPAYCQIERILEVPDHEGKNKLPSTAREEETATAADFGIVTDRNDPGFEDGTGRQLLIKWENMTYSESTYEFERDLIINDVEYKDDLKSLFHRNQKPTRSEFKQSASAAEEEKRRSYKIFGDNSKMDDKERQRKVQAYQKKLEDHVFCNGGQLRDYQAEGIAWMISNYVNRRSCILADEMGLGKTLQTAAFVNLIVHRMKRPGPFLVVVPLSTISHWQREFMNWTGINTIVYHGSAQDREIIRHNEFAYDADRPSKGVVGANQLYLKKCSGCKTKGPWMARVVVTTPEMLVADDWNELAAVEWEVLVVDEAHRLKNHNSKLAVTLRKAEFTFKHKILLTGTPIQNDVKEFWTLLNFIDPESYKDMDKFLELYGDIKSKEKIDELHESIRPYILRRLKEDVEKSVPPKTETLIEVELTIQQKQFYRALYEKNVKFLHKNKKKALDGPSLSNLAMQLRKCCNHLFLLNGVEEDMRQQQMVDKDLSEADFLARGSGKLVLLDKLLPRLKENGHRVLIFSQFKIMLDILEDYLNLRDMKFERIDGSITGKKRQQAIDRYQNAQGTEAPFIMLLSTRAGGVGINLTAADTCIIFDSDWNPQNDLQAQARCHRIGQTKTVKVYRLLSRKTYEMQMFHMSSLKMGLDQAVLKGFESGASGESTMTKEEVERLLRHGAYDIFNEEKSGSAEAESNDFVQQDIDSILERRSRTVVHQNTGSQSNAAGGTFSKASFKAPRTPDGTQNGTTEDIDIEDPEFWTKMVGEAPVEAASDLKPRKRNHASYNERLYERRLDQDIVAEGGTPGSKEADSSDYSSADDEDDDDSDADPSELGKERAKWGGSKANQWKRDQADGVFKALESYGYGNFSSDEFRARLTQSKMHSDTEINRMCWSLLLLAICEGAKDDAASAQRRAVRTAEKKAENDGKAPSAEGGMLATEIDPAGQDAQRDATFRKLWTNNASWARIALKDAVAFAESATPRPQGSMEQSEQEDEISTLFYAGLWASLKSRGWKEEPAAHGKQFTYNAEIFESPKAVLNQVPRIHPELYNMVLPILRTLEISRQLDADRDSKARSKHLELDETSVDLKTLSDFLLRYAPFQLLNDRLSPKKLFINRRALSACCSMNYASTLVRRAKSAVGEMDVVGQLEKLLSADHRSALPHPSWTLKHDAILIGAVAKHGWIERDKSCRAITTDPDIKWGAPFDLSQIEPSGYSSDHSPAKGLSDDEVTVLKSTALRAAEFLTKHHDVLEELKGCNQHLLIDSYGLRQSSDDSMQNEDTSRPEWIVDNDMMMQAVTGGQRKSTQGTTLEPLDLPAKKDLGKRAKTVLLRSIAALESGGDAAVIQSIPVTVNPVESANDYGYTVIDQGDRYCILLAEMVRGILKGSQTKMGRQVRLLCSIAYEEAAELRKVRLALAESTGDIDVKAKADEMEQIALQLALVKKSLQTAARPAKNVIRVMLGMDPQPARGPTETLFPTKVVLEELSAPTKDATKKDVARRDDGAVGERSLIRAMKKAFDKNDGAPCRFSKASEAEVGLQLTMVETLILFTFCAEGIPVYNEKKSEVSEDRMKTYGLSWQEVGSILEMAAKDYHVSAIDKLNKFRAALKKVIDQPDDSPAKIQAAKRVESAEHDESDKENAAKQAVDYAAQPEKLAKKSIMLLEKVRVHSGFAATQSKISHKFENGLGPKVPKCLTKELHSWAQQFGISDSNGMPLAFTTQDLLEQNPGSGFDSTPVAAFLDKKSSRSVAAQIALLTRLKSIFLMSDEERVLEKVEQAVKQSKKLEDVWDKCPSWWEEYDAEKIIQNNFLLLKRLAEQGFLNVLSDSIGFGPAGSLRDLGITKSMVQQRANQLVREVQLLEESEETKRMLEERRNRTAAKNQGFDKSLAECHTKKKGKNGGVQTGLKNFFISASAVSKKESVVLPDSVEASPVNSQGKRKGSSESGEESTSEKKLRLSQVPASVQTVVVPKSKNKRKDSGDSSSDDSVPEKKLRTIVNEEGVIELVPVPVELPKTACD